MYQNLVEKVKVQHCLNVNLAQSVEPFNNHFTCWKIFAE